MPKSDKKMPIKKVRAVIYDVKNGQVYFLILHRILRWRGWEILKETLEKNETPLLALKRGIKEETKIKNFKIISKIPFSEKWEALGKKFEIVAAYLVLADKNQKISLKQRVVEHDDYQWVDKKTALKKLTWPKTKALIKSLKISELKKLAKSNT
jgi:ADP-ribose pyrophosphatase YjhB (NUDIX family)